jgi:hypothetical protein
LHRRITHKKIRKKRPGIQNAERRIVEFAFYESAFPANGRKKLLEIANAVRVSRGA